MSDESKQPVFGFCIFINTFFQGPVPTLFDETDSVYVFATKAEAQREIAEYTVVRLQQFLNGERDFDDAVTIEEYVVKVEVFPDGSIIDANGSHFDACAEAIW